eukprot:TRINITY_DN620_c1_g2_i1.p2 TRINITY_DN620_c1_g2~~TRINITY_DN620_c1_g2_i1.p2  ORF type:complete len:198 (+),score=100.53 TRINITY_DN620_c1_g2_i1:51-644(+)
MAARPDRKDFKRVAPEKEEKKEELPKNELGVSPNRPPRAYIAACIDLFEEGEKTVILKGRGQVIAKVVNIAEIVKRRVKGLHQVTATESTQVVDVYEPKQGVEGKESFEVTKYIAGLSITLSKEALDTSLPGYQAPLADDEVVEEDKNRRKKSSSAGAGAGRGAAKGAAPKGGKGAKGGRGSPAGRGGRGGGRGGAR